MRRLLIAFVLCAGPVAAQPAPPASVPPTVAKPAAIVLDGVPAVPATIRAASLPYMEFRQASFVDWNPATRAMLIATRFGNTNQLHSVAAPGGDRRQITFEDEPVTTAAYAPGGGPLVLAKDRGGDEFDQLYRYDAGRLVLLTDGRSKNGDPLWSRDGRLAAYTSTRRNGIDTDLYVIDPRDPRTDRLVAQVNGGGWFPTDIAPGGGRLLVIEYLSINESRLHEVDLTTGAMRRVTPAHADKVAYGGGRYGADNRIWTTSDFGGDFQRLGTLDPRTGAFTAVSRESWDVEDFTLTNDGGLLAYTVNEAGTSRLKLMDTASGRSRPVATPAGVIGGIDFAPWGELGFTLTSARSPADAYSVDPTTLAVRRWTNSETGGLDPTVNVQPELVTVKSFDGLEVSGFLYRPDAARHPGRRPLVVNIHGGPEGQSRPGFLGRTNYLVNELGLAVFYPNVRGSSGYGKRFVALDNAEKREDSVKDIGAFLDRLAVDPAIDPARIGITGGSYGGYMTYAASQFYAPRIRASVAIVAISDFVTFLTNTEGYRRDLRRVEYGDERVPAMRAVFDRISPLKNAARIRKPIMIVTGGNDPRVPASEADQMVRAVRAGGVEATHILAQNEGHGFAKKENADFQFWATVDFWKRHLLN